MAEMRGCVRRVHGLMASSTSRSRHASWQRTNPFSKSLLIPPPISLSLSLKRSIDLRALLEPPLAGHHFSDWITPRDPSRLAPIVTARDIRAGGPSLPLESIPGVPIATSIPDLRNGPMGTGLEMSTMLEPCPRNPLLSPPFPRLSRLQPVQFMLNGFCLFPLSPCSPTCRSP